MFALTNSGPNCVGFFYTGKESDNGVYNMIDCAAYFVPLTRAAVGGGAVGMVPG